MIWQWEAVYCLLNAWLNLGAEDDLTVKEMERLFMKVNDMKTQRLCFGEQFREQVHTVDIT